METSHAVLAEGLLPTPAAAAPPPLRRRLGKWDVTMVGIGASIGAGIFVVSGEAARVAGPAVVLSFFVAAAVCVLNALCYAEMASRVPVSGSAYVYATCVFGEATGIVTGLNLLFDYHVGAAMIARNLVHYALNLLAACGLPHVPGWLDGISAPGAPFLSFSFVAPAVLLALAFVLCLGVKESARANNVLTGLKMAIVVFIVAVGLAHLDPGNLVPFAPTGVGSVFKASSLCFFAFIGFDAVCNTAEEAVEPSKTLPVGIIASLAACAVLYAGVTLVLVGLTPFDRLPADASLSEAFNGVPGLGWVKVVIDVGAVVGLTTTLFLGIYSQSRMYLAIARDGLLPARFARVHAASGAPRNATLLCAAIACTLAGCFDVEKLSRLLDMGILLSYSVVSSAVLLLRASPSSLSFTGSPAAAAVVSALHTRLREDVETKVAEDPSLMSPPADGGEQAANRTRCLQACLALSTLPLLPGFAVANGWGIPGAVLVVYAVLAAGACTMLVRRIEFAETQGDEGGEKRGPFLTPAPRVTASLALAANAYLLSQRPWEGWARLLCLTGIVFVLHYVAAGRRTALQTVPSTR